MASSRIFYVAFILYAFFTSILADEATNVDFTWINPPPPEPVDIESRPTSENPVWELGSIQILRWTTESLTLRRLSLVQVTPDLSTKEIHIDVDVPKNGLGEQVYDWTVVLNGLDLNLSLLFYLYATPVDDDGFEQRPVSTRRINITHSVNPVPTSTAPATPTDHSNQTLSAAIDAAGTREPLGSGLSHGAVTALSVVASLIGVFMLVGFGYLCWRRVSGSRIATLGPNEEVIGPNEGYLRQVYLNPIFPGHSRDESKEKEDGRGTSYELQEKKD